MLTIGVHFNEALKTEFIIQYINFSQQCEKVSQYSRRKANVLCIADLSSVGLLKSRTQRITQLIRERTLAKGSEPQYVTDIFAVLGPHCHGMVRRLANYEYDL